LGVLDRIEAAFQSGNYTEIAKLLGTLDELDPWTQLYWARLWEETDKAEQAESTYRSLLREAANPKLTLAARQGLKRLQMERVQTRNQAISMAIADPAKSETGVLILAPIAPAQKTDAAQAMAQIMNIEVYSARMLLPSRGIRLYRVGAIGELEFYGQQLIAKGLQVFWLPLSQLQAVTVYPVLHFESIEGIAKVTLQPERDQAPQSLQFAWTDVVAIVKGQIPIFEQVLDRDPRGKLLRKEKTQDYANFCDLHLHKQNCILRFSDAVYQFNRGVSLKTSSEADLHHNLSTAWANWRQVSQILHQHLPQQQPVWSTFENFAETALEHPELLSKLPTHIDLFRREDSNWDPAFQLYSALLFLNPLEA
jgi:hypothetical protein